MNYRLFQYALPAPPLLEDLSAAQSVLFVLPPVETPHLGNCRITREKRHLVPPRGGSDRRSAGSGQPNFRLGLGWVLIRIHSCSFAVQIRRLCFFAVWNNASFNPFPMGGPSGSENGSPLP
jgi:hypothetical protein